MGKYIDAAGVAAIWERAKTLTDLLYLHYWKRRTYVASFELGEVTNRWFLCMGGSSTTGVVNYSDGVVVDPISGKVSLAEPVSTAKYSYNNYSSYSVIKGKYIETYAATLGIVDGEIYYVSPTSAITQSRTEDYDVNADMSPVTGKITTGDWEFVQSNGNDTYQTGIVDGVETIYLGVPFDNALMPIRVERGSYVGTGTYGNAADKMLYLSFSKRPLFVMIAPATNKTFMGIVPGIAEQGYSFSFDSDDEFDYQWDGNTLALYNTGSASHMLNKEGRTYNYFAVYD